MGVILTLALKLSPAAEASGEGLSVGALPHSRRVKVVAGPGDWVGRAGHAQKEKITDPVTSLPYT